ncbi:MAG: DUF4173 domain-containing protein [Ruminococcaceae bacterium]|nr:DUF4173 domain-containing protein [Oscillospiraceae bacterium]
MSNLENNNSTIFSTDEIIPVTPIKEKVFTIKDGIFALVFIVISFVIIKLFFTGDMRTGSVISSGYYHIIVAVMGVLTLFYIGKKTSVTQRLIFGTSMLFCTVPFFSSTATVRLLSWVYAAIMLCLFAYSFSREGDIFGKGAVSRIAEAIIATPFQNFSAGPKSIGTVFSKGKSKVKVILYVLVGLVISLPATFVCVFMLSSADENFDRIAGGIAKFMTNDIGTNIITLLFSLPLAFLLFGYLANTNEREEIKERNDSVTAVVPIAMVCSAITPILVSYVLFFICQLPYFLGAFTGVLPEGYSFSEYARSGFFELCVVCFINFFILILANIFSRNREDGKKSVTLRVFLSVLCISSLILIVSALSKMLLYIGELGLTEKRFYTSWFMLALAVVFIIELVREIKPSIPAVKLQIAGFSVMLSLLCFCDPDARIAQNNVEGYLSGKYQTVDLYSMYDLSESALPYIVKLPENDNKVNGYLSDYKESLRDNMQRTVYFPISIPALNAQNYLSDM